MTIKHGFSSSIGRLFQTRGLAAPNSFLRNGLYCVGWGVKLYLLTHWRVNGKI